MNIITSIDVDEISVFRNLKDKSLSNDGLIICESEKVVLKFLDSDAEVYKLFIEDKFYEKHRIFIESKVSSECVYVAQKSIMEQIVGHRLHNGIMALGPRPLFIDEVDIDDRCLILNGLSSPENVGTIVRSCAAFNIRTLIIDEKTCSPYMRRCIRVSMGNIFSIKVHKTKNLESFIERFQHKGYEFYATANIDGAVSVKDVNYPDKCGIITGSEGHGIDQNILKVSDHIIKIDIDPTVAHLNAAIASGVFLYSLSK